MLGRLFKVIPLKKIKIGQIYASSVTAQRTETSVSENDHKSDADNISFRDSKVAFAALSTPELLRSSLVFILCSYPFFVENNKNLMDIGRKVLGKGLFKVLMKSTFYGQFVAGEDQEQIQSTVQRYRQYGVKSILDHSIEKDIAESDTIKKLEETLHEAVELPNASTEGINKQYQPSLKFADRRRDVVSARTYFYESEAQCDENMKIFMSCIDASARGIANEGFTALKLTALGRPQLLLQFSDFLVQMERFFNLLLEANEKGVHKSNSQESIDLESFKERLKLMGVEISCNQTTKYFTILDKSGTGTIDLLDWMHLTQFEHDLADLFKVKNKKTGKVEQIVSTLTKQGIEEMRSMIRRIDNLAQYARSKNVRLMIDAEHSYFQPAIRRIAIEMMRRFNKDYNVVFNTYQCYLKSALEELRQDLHMAEKNDFYFGAKLVRGAYVKQERKRAEELGYPDPINPTYDATTKMFEKCLEETLSAIDRRPRGRVSIMVATHNEDTVRFALNRMKEHGIEPEHRLICFGQLLGMCDHVSFPLGNAGYSVYKYVPYGPVEEVLPYLSRRAYENQSVLSNISIERQMRWDELKRRIRTGQVFLKP